MQRILLFFFLTLGIPAGIYWASHDFESPGANLRRFSMELRALGGKPTEPAAPDAEQPEEGGDDADVTPPRPETGPKAGAKPDAGPEAKPDAERAPEAGPETGPETNKRKPLQKEPRTEPKPEPVQKPPLERAKDLYAAGKFEEAALTFVGIDEVGHALSQLGIAFQQAFPADLPDQRYYVITTKAGSGFEGFGKRSEHQITLTSPSGRSLSLPLDVITSETTLSKEDAVERMAKRIRTESSQESVKGPRLFVLVQEAMVIGRPQLAAPLLPRLLLLDEADPFFLSSVRNRAPAEYQDDLYRAFGGCQVPEDEAAETVARAPRRLGEGQLGKIKRTPSKQTSIKDKKALELVRKAGPHRIEGKRLHRKVFLAGRKEARVEDIDAAIRELETAISYYEKAIEIEDNDEIHAMLRYSSRLAFQLRFWREQVGGG